MNARSCAFIEKDRLGVDVSVDRPAYRTDTLNHCTTLSKIDRYVRSLVKEIMQDMDKSLDPAQAIKNEYLCVSNVCASVDVSEAVNESFEEVNNESDFATRNICVSIARPEAKTHGVLSIVD